LGTERHGTVSPDDEGRFALTYEVLAPGEAGISRRLVLLLAVATGVTVASNYYVQPLLAEIRHSLHASSAAAGLVVTAAQIGYALGLLCLVPLGDVFERRRLIVVMSLVTAAALVGAALSPSISFLYAFAAIAGAGSVVAQLLVAFGATLAPAAARGRVVGTVMSGLLLGILLARTISGYVAEASSWRGVYAMAAGLMLLTAVVLEATLPRYQGRANLSYPQILRSVLDIFRTEAVLRRRSLYGALSFATFAVLWTSLAFLLAGAPYRYGDGTIGLFGLAGAAGALMATVAGRLADKGLQRQLSVATCLIMLAGFAILWAWPHVLVSVIAGIVVLDVGCQGIHITNQSEIYKLAGEARNRVNSAYMTCYFIGGTLGSLASALVYSSFGWTGVGALGTSLGFLSTLLSLGEARFRRGGSVSRRGGSVREGSDPP
jgi:predicted MFS family arabinose efflux permease